MNKSILSFALVSCFAFLMGCAGLHRGIPRGERHRRIEPEREAAVQQTVISTGNQEAEQTELAATAISVAAEQEIEANNVEQAADISVSHLKAEESGDTLIATEATPDEAAQIAQALESEEVAHNAYRFSWVPIGWTLFFPLLLVGIIGTAICLNNFKKYEFVTEKGLEYKRKAKATVVLSSLLSIAILVATILIIILIAVFLL